MRDIFELFKDTFEGWNRDHAQRLGAALAYYTVFSLGPLLMIVIAIAGLVFGAEAARNQILGQIQGLVGQQGAQFIQSAIQSASRPRDSIIATIIGIATLLLGALGVFGQLQDALNAIWGVKPKPNRGLIKGLIQDRLLSFTMVLGTGFLLLVSLALSAALNAAIRYLGGMLPFSANILEGANFFVSFVIFTILFAFIFKYLPDAEIGWGDVWIAGLLTSLMFVIGNFLLGLYLGNSAIASSYGAAGSVIIVLVWVYYSAQILFFGAEFSKAFALHYGKGIVPAPNAERVVEEVHA